MEILKRTTWLFLVWLVGTTNVLADEDFTLDEIRARVAQGEILSLRALEALHPEIFQGRILDLEVEQEDGDLVYEIEIIDNNYHVRKVLIHAKSGKLISHKLYK